MKENKEINLFDGSLENIFRAIPDYDLLISFKDKENWDTQIKFRNFVKKLSGFENTDFGIEIAKYGLSVHEKIRDTDDLSEKLKMIEDLIKYIELNYDLSKDI